jgi:hypothetical protein
MKNLDGGTDVGRGGSSQSGITASRHGMRNLDGRMTGRTTGRMDGKEDQHQHRTDGHHGYYYVGDINHLLT